jgi:nucleotide-binding universal stress UspA family protein
MLKADLTLFTVVPTVTTQKAFHGLSSLQLPISSRLSLEIESQEVAQHLIEHFKEIKGELASDIQVHTRVVRGDIVKQITKAANDLSPCIIILGTHGKIGMEAFWSDSIAFRLALQSDMPMLFIPL